VITLNTVEPESGRQYPDVAQRQLLSGDGRATTTSKEWLRSHVWKISGGKPKVKIGITSISRQRGWVADLSSVDGSR